MAFFLGSGRDFGKGRAEFAEGGPLSLARRLPDDSKTVTVWAR